MQARPREGEPNASHGTLDRPDERGDLEQPDQYDVRRKRDRDIATRIALWRFAFAWFAVLPGRFPELEQDDQRKRRHHRGAEVGELVCEHVGAQQLAGTEAEACG